MSSNDQTNNSGGLRIATAIGNVTTGINITTGRLLHNCLDPERTSPLPFNSLGSLEGQGDKALQLQGRVISFPRAGGWE